MMLLALLTFFNFKTWRLDGRMFFGKLIAEKRLAASRPCGESTRLSFEARCGSARECSRCYCCLARCCITGVCKGGLVGAMVESSSLPLGRPGSSISYSLGLPRASVGEARSMTIGVGLFGACFLLLAVEPAES